MISIFWDDEKGKSKASQLYVVDLSGSERMNKSGVINERLKETK